MPKVRRKRRTTTASRLARPSRKNVVSAEPIAVVRLEENKANYFDLIEKPAESIKSKKNDEFIHVEKPPRNLKIPSDWNVKLGDVLSWSEGRPTETFFVTNDQTLLKNPDTSGSGYLTIPLSISEHFPDVLNYFSNVLDKIGRNYVTSIELSPTDSFFVSNFSKKSFPTSILNRKDIHYSFDPNEDVLHVSFASNSERSKEFPLKTTKTDEILQWIDEENETQTKFIVSFHFQGKDLCKKAPRGIVKGLPSGWTCEQNGSMTIGSDQIQGSWKCQGPEKSKINARKAIDKFYRGFQVEIQ